MADYLPNTEIKVSIDGNMLPRFQSLKLEQEINEHHSFEIFLDNEVGELPKAHSLNKSVSWLGKKVSIYIGDKQFVGIITQVGMKRSHGPSYLCISGCSTTYLLENDVHFASWNDKTLEEIVSELTEKAGVLGRIKPEKTSKLEYECQYQETNFGFIQRLAKQHFEWLYFDGMSLVFGKPDLGSPIPLDTERHLPHLDICVQTGAKSLTAYSHQSGSNNTLNSTSPDEAIGFNNLGGQAFDASLELFKTPSNHYATARAGNKNELDTYLKKKQQADAAMSHYIAGESSYVGLMLGDVVEIKSSIKVLSSTFIEEPIGNYIITKITHFATLNNEYTCDFIAIPASVQTLPTPHVSFPIAQPQMATVVSNEDPRKQGRVQVRMNWQIDGMKTSWIRVLSPDAGGSGKVASNRGFVFIPEEGDQVMVAFRYNDPNRPYVQGSLFNGTNAGGGGEGNKTKSLTTRSGCTVSLDDDKGSITITDASGNMVLLEGNQKISITAVDTLALSAPNILINGNDTVKIVGKTVDISAQNELTETSPKTNIMGTDELNLGSSNGVSIASGGSVNLQAPEINSSSSGQTTIDAAILKLNS